VSVMGIRVMKDIKSSDLKSILHSKRANMFYLEYCRVMQKDGRVLYLTEAKDENQYFNIPIANTTVLLLGNGTSITQAAMRMLAQAGVLVGFCGGGGTPLYMGNEVEWLTPQSEYRPTEYLQGWVSFWFDDNKRLEAAKIFQRARIAYLQKVWGKDRELRIEGFQIEDAGIQTELDKCCTCLLIRSYKDYSTPTSLWLSDIQPLFLVVYPSLPKWYSSSLCPSFSYH